MNLKIQHRNLDISQMVQRTIERKARKVQSLLPTFSDDTLDLHVTVEKLPRGSQYQTVLVLTTPQTSIRVENIADNTTGSVQMAFDELLRKLKKFKSQLNREKFWQRQPRSAPGTAAVESSQELENLINQNLDKISNYVRRELFHRTVAENLPPGILQPEAVVDEVFLLMTSLEKAKPGAISYEQWMYQVAREQIEKRLSELDRDSVHVEDAAESRELPWDDEAFNFFQPDESLKLEDVLRDRTTSNPEERMEYEEAEEELHKAIARLPRKIRESFVLTVLEGFAPFEASMITGKDPAKIEKDVDEARKRLREELRPGQTRPH